MRGDLPAAAFRLLTALPVRTIERRAPEVKKGRPEGSQSHSIGRENISVDSVNRINKGGGVARPIRINGTTYESVTAAKRALHKSTGQIYVWLREGRAKYA